MGRRRTRPRTGTIRLVRNVTVFAVIAVSAIVLAPAAGEAARPAVSPPAAYVRAVCSAADTLGWRVLRRSGRLDLTTIHAAAQGKAALKSYVTDLVGYSRLAVRAMRSAGVPAVDGGARIASAIVTVFTKLDGAMTRAEHDANALPTKSPSAFITAATKLGKRLKRAAAGTGSELWALLSSPQLRAASGADPAC